MRRIKDIHTSLLRTKFTRHLMHRARALNSKVNNDIDKCLTSEFQVKFHAKNRYHTNCEAMRAISDFLDYLLFLNRVAKGAWGKLNVLYFCEPRQCANNGNPFKVNVNVVLFSVSGFLKFF